MAKPCTLHPIPQAEQFFKIETANVGGRGGLPLAFSWGFKGAILSRERMAPLPCAAPLALQSPRPKCRIVLRTRAKRNRNFFTIS